MTMKSANEIWNFLKQEYEGKEKVRDIQILNLTKNSKYKR